MSDISLMKSASENNDIIFVRPVDLNISFSDYFKLKFEAINKGLLLSDYLQLFLSDEESLLSLDQDTLLLFRKLSSFINNIDYYIIWSGDGFWRIKRKNITR